MQSNSHCNIVMAPQPRKPNHTIMADTINPARRQMATFLPVCLDDNGDLDGGFCSFTDR
jgi:hypothetical protein